MVCTASRDSSLQIIISTRVGNEKSSSTTADKAASCAAQAEHVFQCVLNSVFQVFAVVVALGRWLLSDYLGQVFPKSVMSLPDELPQQLSNQRWDTPTSPSIPRTESCEAQATKVLGVFLLGDRGAAPGDGVAETSPRDHHSDGARPARRNRRVGPASINRRRQFIGRPDALDDQHRDGPVIIPNGPELILDKNETVTLLCKGKRPISFTLQEAPEEDVGSFRTSERTYNTSEDAEYPYRAELRLHNVNEFAVRFYACHDRAVDAAALLSDMREEPRDTEHVSFIYVYVNGTESLLVSMVQFIIVKNSPNFVIACRPTMPDVEVSLNSKSQSDRPDGLSTRFHVKIGFIMEVGRVKGLIFNCTARKGDKKQMKVITIRPCEPQKPTISGTRYFFEGRTIIVNCTVPFRKDSATSLQLFTPDGNVQDGHDLRIKIETNEQTLEPEKLYKTLLIQNATREDEGTYKCTTKCGSTKSNTMNVTFLTPEEAFVNLSRGAHGPLIETERLMIKLHLNLVAYPEVTVTVKKNDIPLRVDGKKYVLVVDDRAIEFTIYALSLIDIANYTIIAENEYQSAQLVFDIRKKVRPTVDIGGTGDKIFEQGTIANMQCVVQGYPLPAVVWSFLPFCNETECAEQNLTSIEKIESLYEVKSFPNISALVSGNITCTAYYNHNKTSQTRRFLVYEIKDGFGVNNEQNLWYPENENITITCKASKFNFKNITWSRSNIKNDSLHQVVSSENRNSLISELKIWQVALDDSNAYTCRAFTNDNNMTETNVNVTIAKMKLPMIFNQSTDDYIEVKPYGPTELHCTAHAVPTPRIVWYKDDAIVDGGTNKTNIREMIKDHATVESILTISQTQEEDKGKYKCEALSDNYIAEKYYNVNLKEKSNSIYLSIIGVIGFLLVILTVFLIWKMRKEKQFRKELNKAGLLHFKEGAAHSLNPDLAIDDQAELLPYDDRFEFPPEKLTLGKQLGSGAYGVVFKAEARGIINAEESTTVAVKMVKKTADNMYIKALISELKIMIYLGKHINILNLLGACTKNVAKRELSVIMEYCKFGSIDIYMKQHREVFIDQLGDGDKNGFGRINRGFSCSSGNSGSQSDYFGSNHTQATDHTFLTTGNAGKRKESESEYIQAEWRSNYVMGYEGRILRPLYSRDLLCWAFQIARGMEYLASRKVLHGDLAARNVLLAEDNVVKICDFGLAKSIYKNDEYQKKGNIPLPVKWLAIECITDRTFSTQSDVWAFGIVLWELFTLAKTPYPNMHHTQLLPWLLEGNRLGKPRYADDRLYKVMLQCWEQNPTVRPSFTQLQDTLGSFLEDNVRNHYVDLNAPYLDMNAATNENREDYLAIVSAPDYNIMMRPRYVNIDNVLQPIHGIPPPLLLPQDEEGYLAMSPSPNNKQIIFSPRLQSDRFDFDARKLNMCSEASSHGSELTPMLTVNNLPARGSSESDHEGSASPYLNMCPRIEEETDEVFETKQNLKNSNHDRAVTNPTYIAYDVSMEKNPKDIAYANVPNGLVN
ncbi:Vascular endothelial growth factor receptor 1 [Eumeta japonica]|uniref:Vascular endothelial growth factor receptor 1 n=1 Tax=Eumeta variegata TaxID=151549 RepID=A0A4C1SNH7_EUMVA|nr:Vascular endothelial growth factor receptor 1 [Eumeta japonica]